MPFGDGTGPGGMGPMTGRGAGYCAGFGGPGFANLSPWRRWFGFGWRGWGRGSGRGLGRGLGPGGGRGFGWRRYAPRYNPWW